MCRHHPPHPSFYLRICSGPRIVAESDEQCRLPLQTFSHLHGYPQMQQAHHRKDSHHLQTVLTAYSHA